MGKMPEFIVTPTLDAKGWTDLLRQSFRSSPYAEIEVDPTYPYDLNEENFYISCSRISRRGQVWSVGPTPAVTLQHDNPEARAKHGLYVLQPSVPQVLANLCKRLSEGKSYWQYYPADARVYDLSSLLDMNEEIEMRIHFVQVCHFSKIESYGNISKVKIGSELEVIK